MMDIKEPFILLNNNKQLLEYQNNFSTNLKAYVEKAGGLHALLSICGTFSFDEKQTNVLYLTEREDEYDEYKREKEILLKSQTPKCEDALFTETNFKRNFTSNDVPDITEIDNDILTSAKPKIVEINGYSSDEEDEDEGEPQKCVVDAKFQVDTLNTAENTKLAAINKRMFTEVKTLRHEKEKLEQEKKEEEIKTRKAENEVIQGKLHIQVSLLLDLIDKMYLGLIISHTKIAGLT